MNYQGAAIICHKIRGLLDVWGPTVASELGVLGTAGIVCIGVVGWTALILEFGSNRRYDFLYGLPVIRWAEWPHAIAGVSQVLMLLQHRLLHL